MNLIEVMLNYRDSVREDGRKAGDRWLRSIGLEESLFQRVRESVNDSGMFVTSDNRRITIYE